MEECSGARDGGVEGLNFSAEAFASTLSMKGFLPFQTLALLSGFWVAKPVRSRLGESDVITVDFAEEVALGVDGDLFDGGVVHALGDHVEA